MKSRFLELIPDFQNNTETLNVISAWHFSASVVSSGIADEIFDRGSGDSKDTADGFRNCFHKVNGGGFSVGTKLSTCLYA